MTPEDYVAYLNELISLTIGPDHRPVPRQKRNEEQITEVMAALDKFQAENPCYHVVCVRESYVGQGVTWMPGDEYGKTWLPNQAQAWVKMFDDDSWVGPGAFEIRVVKP